MGVSLVRSPSAERRDDLVHRDLVWLASVLWPNADAELSPTRVPPGRRMAEAYAVMPNAEHPKLLLPFASPALVGPAVRRYDDAMSGFARARRSIYARLAGSSLGWARFPPLVMSYDREPAPGELPTDYFRRVLGRPDTALAISFGPPRPNRKPVAQVLTLDGHVLGFAKIGWNPPTRDLLRNEASALRRWSRRGPQTFRVPALVHHAEWFDGRDVLVTAPVPMSADQEVRAGRLPSLEVIREIAATGGTGLMPLRETPWWRSVLRRLEPADAPVATVIRWMGELHGRRLIHHGSWHGDLAQQNMSTVGGRLHIWDWERAADGAPLGLDPIHFHFQHALRGRHDVARASRAAARRATPTLRALGVPREDDALLSACHLADILLRFEEGRHHGADVRPGMTQALLGELRRWVGRA
jgi:hypothetical protein